jgi:hypothetical protein
MAGPIDLRGGITAALDTAFERQHVVVLGYVDDDGHASLSPRGSTHVHSATQIAVWARQPDTGLAKAITARPVVSLLYLGGPDGPGPRFLQLRGTAHVDEAAGPQVYAKMPEPEQERDADRKGVAVIIEIEHVRGFGPDGPFEQSA